MATVSKPSSSASWAVARSSAYGAVGPGEIDAEAEGITAGGHVRAPSVPRHPRVATKSTRLSRRLTAETFFSQPLSDTGIQSRGLKIEPTLSLGGMAGQDIPEATKCAPTLNGDAEQFL